MVSTAAVTHSISGPSADLLSMQSMYMCSLWWIQRVDGQSEYYTNWDEDLFVQGGEDGLNNTFLSSAGIALSSTSREMGLRSQSLSAAGIIDGLDVDRLAGGVYHMAQVMEWVVDARWPHIRGTEKNVYWVTGVEHDDDVWKMSLEGHGRRLKEVIGVPYSRTCKWSLGQGGCAETTGTRQGVDILTYTYGHQTNLQVSQVDTTYPRQVFRINVYSGQPSLGFSRTFTHGRVRFTSGKNADMVYEIMDYTPSGVVVGGHSPPFTLFEQTVEDIEVGDTCIIEEGCDGTWDSCVTYQNWENFGGYRHIPGAQKARQAANLDWGR